MSIKKLNEKIKELNAELSKLKDMRDTMQFTIEIEIRTLSLLEASEKITDKQYEKLDNLKDEWDNLENWNPKEIESVEE